MVYATALASSICQIKDLYETRPLGNIGGNVGQSDCNIPDVNPVRQNGFRCQKYFMHTFGKEAVVEWLPGLLRILLDFTADFNQIGSQILSYHEINWIKSERPGLWGNISL